MRRTFALVSSTIALIVVALLANSAGAAMSFAGDGQPLAHASVHLADGHASEPDAPTRVFVRAQALSMGRVHASDTGDGARSITALGVGRASLDPAAHREPGIAVDARQHGVTSPGQPAPSSRAPPLG